MIRKNHTLSWKYWLIGLLFLLALFSFSSCRLSDANQVDVYQINEILDDIENGVLLYNPEQIVQYVHPEFLHNGNYARDIEMIWQIRTVNYSRLKLEQREIKISYIYATVKMKMTLKSGDREIVSDEPSDEYGDLSYFIRENGKWYLYGNQRYIP
ncbi:MAG: hypothetical protein WCX83_01010 [Candidatus Cloacimonas sp.]|nr:hypothetical protein [Candidatus Cloacimonadota bacterium]